MPVRILVADDHQVVRTGLRALLESKTGWQVCAEAANGREAVEKAGQLKPDVAVLDIGMPLLNGVEATRRVCNEDLAIASAAGVGRVTAVRQQYADALVVAIGRIVPAGAIECPYAVHDRKPLQKKSCRPQE